MEIYLGRGVFTSRRADAKLRVVGIVVTAIPFIVRIAGIAAEDGAPEATSGTRVGGCCAVVIVAGALLSAVISGLPISSTDFVLRF